MEENEAQQIGEELQEPFKKEMAKGKKGVVLFSTGTVVLSVNWPQKFRQNLFNAFRHFPDYHFIVKIERTDNVGFFLFNILPFLLF